MTPIIGSTVGWLRFPAAVVFNFPYMLRPAQRTSAILLRQYRHTMTETSLTYAPDRAEELKENIKGVLDEIAQASEGSSKVSAASYNELTLRLVWYPYRSSNLRPTLKHCMMQDICTLEKTTSKRW